MSRSFGCATPQNLAEFVQNHETKLKNAQCFCNFPGILAHFLAHNFWIQSFDRTRKSTFIRSDYWLRKVSSECKKMLSKLQYLQFRI